MNIHQDPAGCIIVIPEPAIVAYSDGLIGNVSVAAFERFDTASVQEDVLALVYAIKVPRLIRATTIVVVEPDFMSEAARSLTTAAVLVAVSVSACVVGVSNADVSAQFAAERTGTELITENLVACIEAMRRRAWITGNKFGEVLRQRDFEMVRAGAFGLSELLQSFAAPDRPQAQA